MGLFLGLVGAGISIVSSVISASSKSSQMQSEYDDKLQELQREQAQLTQQKANASADVSRANALLDTKISNTTTNQNTAKEQSANSLAATDQITNAQMSALKVQALQAEGQAQQQVANSGFRNAGTATANVYNQEQTDKDAIATQEAENNLQRYQTFSNAKNTYTSYSQQISDYQTQKASNTAQYEESWGENGVYQMQLKNTSADYKELQDYDIAGAKSQAFWGTALSGVGQALSGAASLF